MGSRLMTVLIVVVVMAVAGVGVLYASTNGPLDPSTPSGSTPSYTLEQIYQRLTTGNYFAKQSGFTEPASGPGTATMHTLDAIMAQAQPRALAKRVAKTGQMLCYDAANGTIACAGTGQDGQYQAGIDPAVAPTGGQMGAYNTPAWTGVRFADNGDGTVTDNLTALIWLKNANCSGTRDWTTALSDANGLAAPSCGLSDSSVAGDWRLPNVNELHSLIDLTQITYPYGSSPALPAGHPFTNVQIVDHYFSSTTDLNYPNVAWAVYMWAGHVVEVGKTSARFVWPVRGGQ